MIYAKIKSTGSYLPEKVVTNTDLAETIDTSDEWIVQRTGIRRRHIIAENENVVTMAVAAARRALEQASLMPDDIDMIIVATCTADQVFPATACAVQAQLGAANCAAFDIQAACSGFIYGLSIAQQFIASGQYKKTLLIGSEAMSRVLDWQDRSSCILFGDGAGAVVLEASAEPGILSTHLNADGNFKDVLYLNSADVVKMQGNAVFKLAVKWLSQVAKEALEYNHMQPSDIDWVVPHQANIRIINSTVKSLGIAEDKVIVTVDEHANTSAASIPLALDVGVRDGRIKPGQNLLFEAFGGGLTWGSALVRL